MIPSPDARSSRVTDAWYYRELLMALMLQEDITGGELAARLGIPRSTLYRYLQLVGGAAGQCPRPLQYPQQYLAELMLSNDARCRIRNRTTILQRS